VFGPTEASALRERFVAAGRGHLLD